MQKKLQKYKFLVFLDRDGTIIEDKNYLSKTSEINILPQAIEGLTNISHIGGALVIITNQSGVNRGFFTIKDVEKVNNKIISILQSHKCYIAKIYVCPHTPDESCNCRKPKIQNLLKASKLLNIPLEKAFMIGDRTSDMKTGENANIYNILIGKNNQIQNCKQVENINEASEYIRIIAKKNNWI